jgi:uncharacterized membrane protein
MNVDILGGLLVFFFIVVGVAFFVFWIWAFIQVLQRSDEQGYKNGNQLIWVLILLFLTGLGAILYYFLEHRPRTTSGF